MTIASCHTQACFDAWIHCEDLLTNMSQFKTSLSKKFFKVVDECALICMGTFHAIKSSSQNISRMALLCVGICEECAELCESLNEEEFLKCAATCRLCSETISQIAFTDLQ
jgi:hypothetical protein